MGDLQKLFYGGDIITMVHETDTPKAVVITGKKITYVGDLSEAEQILEPDAVRVDLEGKTLMPSFIDPHSHISLCAQFSSFVDLSECTDFAEIVNTLKAYLKEHPVQRDGALVATGYDHNFLREEAHPSCDVLDRVSDTIPICLFHTSGHMAVANSALLKAAGITKATPAPRGGKIGRFEDGNPNGYFEEPAAMEPVLMTAFSRVKADPVRQMQDAQDLYLKYGITTVQEGSANAENIDRLIKMAENGSFKIDVVAYAVTGAGGAGDIMERYPEAAKKYCNRFKIGGAKIILDGSPQGRTAWLSKPYAGEKEYCGYPSLPDEVLEGAVRSAVNGKYQLLAHCNGDAASEQFIRCYEKILEETGCLQDDLRPVMIHCQTVRDDQLDRMVKIKILPSFFVAHTYYWGDVHLKNLGEERGNRISPVRSALNRNLKYNFHQDSPVIKPDMMQTVWCAVNRLTRKGVKIGKEQCVSVFDALKGVTVNAAYAYHEEKIKGTIEEGKLADLVILDRNPLKTDKLKLRDISVEETIKEGKTLYRKNNGI